jgi:hypothetical protein
LLAKGAEDKSEARNQKSDPSSLRCDATSPPSLNQLPPSPSYGGTSRRDKRKTEFRNRKSKRGEDAGSKQNQRTEDDDDDGDDSWYLRSILFSVRVFGVVRDEAFLCASVVNSLLSDGKVEDRPSLKSSYGPASKVEDKVAIRSARLSPVLVTRQKPRFSVNSFRCWCA